MLKFKLQVYSMNCYLYIFYFLNMKMIPHLYMDKKYTFKIKYQICGVTMSNGAFEFISSSK